MRTKIICTIGPASDSPGILKELVQSGIRMFRLNFSHGNAKDFQTLVRRLRDVEEATGAQITLLQDLSGPKIRTGELPKSPLKVSEGETVLMGDSGSRPEGEENFIPFDHPELIDELAPGDTVRLSDGGLKFRVESRKGRVLTLLSMTPGLITSRKGVSFPGKKSKLPALTEKDKVDLEEGLELGMDAVALSFVQGPEDIARAKAVITRKGYRTPVIAKLERQVAVDRLEEILNIADGVMVARGDLGLECPLASLPTLQKRIIRACNRRSKPVIVATQMLLSMVDNSMPTRAETTDVANAILDGADALMLSEETAVGKYPVQCVQYMADIARAAEELYFESDPEPVRHSGNCPESYLSYAACLLAGNIKGRALVAHTDSGSTARLLSACRPAQEIFGLTPFRAVAKYLNLSWGVKPVLIPEEPEDHLRRVEKYIQENHDFYSGEKLVITAGHPKSGQTHAPTNLLKIFVK
jgi:pyruvate kinase